MKVRTFINVGVCMLAIAGVAAAQTVVTKPQPAPVATASLAEGSSEITVSGKVVSSTRSELVVDTDAGPRMTFALDPNAMPATSFRAGERVTVQYHSLTGGTVFQAAKVVVEPAPAAAEPDYEDLPQTASSSALIGLLGLLAGAGALLVRFVRS